MNYQRFYDRVAWIYAKSAKLIPPWRKYVEAVLPYIETGERILEIGPGPGLLLEKIARRCQLACGLDLSWGMLRMAGQQLNRSGLTPLLVQGDAVYLPFERGCFDAVALTFVLSAIPDAQGALSEIYRVLRPGGRVLLVDAGMPSNGNHMGVLLARLWTLFGDSMRDEAALMASTGFAVDERREFGAFQGIRLVVAHRSAERIWRVASS